MIFTWKCQNKDDQKTVRQVLTQAGFSNRLLKKIRRLGSITGNGRSLRLIDRISSGDILLISLPEPQDQTALRQDPELDVIYIDDWYVAINKKPGQVIHPTATHNTGTITDRLSTTPLHPILRLDRETSGVILIARMAFAHHFTSTQKMKKIYLGLVHGRFFPPRGILTGSVKRSEDSFMRRVIHPDGKEAITLYREIAYSTDANVSLVSFELLTGRTHQIRLHCLWYAHPLVGDTMYGLQQLTNITTEQDYVRPDLLPKALALCQPEQILTDNLINRHALHASHLEFEHVASRQTIAINADLTPDLDSLFKQLNITVKINCN